MPRIVLVEQPLRQAEGAQPVLFQGRQRFRRVLLQRNAAFHLQHAHMIVQVGLLQLIQPPHQLLARGQTLARTVPVVGAQIGIGAVEFVLIGLLGLAAQGQRDLIALIVGGGQLPGHPLIEFLIGVFAEVEGLDLARLFHARLMRFQFRLGDLDRHVHGRDLLFDLRRVPLRDSGLGGPIVVAAVVFGGDGHDARLLIEIGRYAVADSRAHFYAFAEIHAAVGQAEGVRQQVAGNGQTIDGRSGKQRRLGQPQQVQIAVFLRRQAVRHQALVVLLTVLRRLQTALQRLPVGFGFLDLLLLGLRHQLQELGLLTALQLRQRLGVLSLQRGQQAGTQLDQVGGHIARPGQHDIEAVVGHRACRRNADGAATAGRGGLHQLVRVHGRLEQGQFARHAIDIHTVANLVQAVFHPIPVADEVLVLVDAEVTGQVFQGKGVAGFC